MNKVLDTIREAIKKPMEEMDIMITSITYEAEGNYNFLTIELDKVNGIDLDTIVAATEVINPIIDELDLIDDSYILDIISKEKGE
ncbi:MAG: ribosome maturation factor RimP [Candidatus Coprovivens sp.]